MNDLKLLNQLEAIEKISQLAKNIAVEFGADENAFSEADAKLAEIKKEVKSRLQGGISSGNGESFEHGEYIISKNSNNKDIECKKCGGKCYPSTALVSPLCGNSEWADGEMIGSTLSASSDAITTNCLKCEKCGHSFVLPK